MVNERNVTIAYLSLAAAAISLFVIIYVKWQFVFHDARVAVFLVWISMICGGLSLIFGTYAYRNWQSIAAFLLIAIAAYFVLFTPLYAVT
jgi:ABC-type uncharacterized transport system YnjBCD permease subunit